MAVLQDFKCPCCDGAIEFDSSLQKMKCPYCSLKFEIADLQAYAEAAASAPAAPAGPKFCQNCGAPADGGKFCQSCGSQL